MRISVAIDLTDAQADALQWGVDRDSLGRVEDFCANNIRSVADSFAEQRSLSDARTVANALAQLPELSDVDKAEVAAAIAVIKRITAPEDGDAVLAAPASLASKAKALVTRLLGS